ncbi:hypothetical protein EDB84DRAFT_691383 [Lactarius hengduanensis]|nr:hypothetical protein EDB84DRAFT_691383 [Lactarius hengduanensis]
MTRRCAVDALCESDELGPAWDSDVSQPLASQSLPPPHLHLLYTLSLEITRSCYFLAVFINPFMTSPSSIPSFTMVHLKTPFILSIPTTISPKFRRSDPKGFVNVSRVAGQRTPRNRRSVKTRISLASKLYLARPLEARGRIPRIFLWFPLKASPFLFYHNIIDSIVSHRPSYRKFYIPHYRHSLRWKRSGVHYACTTETVKGPVTVLESAMQRAPPQLKILDPLFHMGSSKPQRMHKGLPLGLLDFLLVTAMLLVTPSEEWMNVMRTSPSDSFLDDGSPSDFSPPTHFRGYSGDRSMAFEYTSSR